MQTKTLLNTVLDELNDFKAINITPLDVHNLTSITDFMIISTGNSNRHVGAIASNLIKKMKALQVEPIGVESDSDNEWILVDFGDIVVHIMQQKTRDYYNLEKLWAVNHYQNVASA